jgi:glutathione S-transferase-like protein
MIFWGVIASPYQLKMQSLADFAEFRWQRWPGQAGSMAGLAMRRRLSKAVKASAVARYPERVPDLDEYPAVPFYSFDQQQFYYDSTGLALHLDAHPQSHEARLLPEDPALGFVCQLIDEAFDEFGLYMVHHNRWVTSAQTNRMGVVTGEELGKLVPIGLGRLIARLMPRRQVRRCPYLFSVAPVGFDAGVAAALTPPSREGFPPTHDLLDEAWRRYLAAMEGILAQQPYLLGDRFTLADASAYGQLSMNLIDGAAAQLLQQLAPLTYRWLCHIRDGKHVGSRGALYFGDGLHALLDVISETFMPLMQQNAQAYDAGIAEGETLFNEAAFDQGRALYRGTLLGKPYRAVVKSFQVAVWRQLQQNWRALDTSLQVSLMQRFNALQGLSRA